jgi:hypothetical protein
MQGSWVKEGLVRSVLELEKDAATGEVAVTHSKANFAEQRRAFRVRPAFRRDATRRVAAVTFSRIAEALPADRSGHRDLAPAQEGRPVVEVPTPAVPTLTTDPDSRPSPRPILRLVPHVNPPAHPQEGKSLRLHDRIDAEVLAAVRRRGAARVDKEAIAEELGYKPKTVTNALGRLRGAGVLPKPETPSSGDVVGPRAIPGEEGAAR